jgi:hypothetical protein
MLRLKGGRDIRSPASIGQYRARTRQRRENELCPNGAQTNQPRATPGVTRNARGNGHRASGREINPCAKMSVPRRGPNKSAPGNARGNGASGCGSPVGAEQCSERGRDHSPGRPASLLAPTPLFEITLAAGGIDDSHVQQRLLELPAKPPTRRLQHALQRTSEDLRACHPSRPDPRACRPIGPSNNLRQDGGESPENGVLQ